MKPVRIAINGFGRIGRLFFRQVYNQDWCEIVGVNDLGNIDNLAYLLKYDSVYRTFSESVRVENDHVVVGKSAIPFFHEPNPENLPWKKLGVDIVIESTGVFTTYEKASAHLSAGAVHVLMSAPSQDDDGEKGTTVLVGVNEEDLSRCSISSNASCTTNAISSPLAILSETIGVSKAMLSTVHGYTSTQSLVDTVQKGSDVRRGRAAAQNIIPSTTGAAHALGRAQKSFAKAFDGIAFRVPVIAGSVADVVFVSKRKTNVEEVNELLEKGVADARWRGTFAVTRDPVVSSDIIGMPYGALVDLSYTRVVDGDLVKILSWYDNEWGYVATLRAHAEAIAHHRL